MEENIVFAKIPYQYTMYLNRHLIQATACLSVSLRGNFSFQPWELEFPAWKREFKRKKLYFHISD